VILMSRRRGAPYVDEVQDRASGAVVRAGTGGRPGFRYIRKQRHLTCSLDRDRDLSLVSAARAGHPTASDLGSLGHVPP